MGRLEGVARAMSRSPLRAAVPGLLALLALVALVACDDDDGGAAPAGVDATPSGGVTNAPSLPGADQGTHPFPTGEPTLVDASYEPPEDHVPSTGAFLPANGKPTLVFVDAIW